MGGALPQRDLPLPSISSGSPSQLLPILLLLLPLIVSRIDHLSSDLLFADHCSSSSSRFPSSSVTLARTGITVWWSGSTIRLAGTNVLIRNVQ